MLAELLYCKRASNQTPISVKHLSLVASESPAASTFDYLQTYKKNLLGTFHREN